MHVGGRGQRGPQSERPRLRCTLLFRNRKRPGGCRNFGPPEGFARAPALRFRPSRDARLRPRPVTSPRVSSSSVPTMNPPTQYSADTAEALLGRVYRRAGRMLRRPSFRLRQGHVERSPGAGVHPRSARRRKTGDRRSQGTRLQPLPEAPISSSRICANSPKPPGYLSPEQPLRKRAARQLLDNTAAEAVLVTLGAEGMMLICADGSAIRFPALAREVYDVSGAGDTVAAVLAAASRLGIVVPGGGRTGQYRCGNGSRQSRHCGCKCH